MQFVPPSKQARDEAIGPVQDLPPAMRRLLNPSSFIPMGKPEPADWLTVKPEPGQTYSQFVRSHPNFADELRRTIYLQPLEEFSTGGPNLSQLKAFTEAYFSMPVQVLPVLPAKAGKFTARFNGLTRKPQLLTGDILTVLKQHLPKDAYCLLGITMRDLYPGPAWNYVFGEAYLQDRVGIYSLIRYDPQFWGEDKPDRTTIILRRSCNVLAHETGHMFGIEHCIYFHCVMNGSNSLPETDSAPLHLCPVDLRKLYASVKFDPVARYAHLRDFCHNTGLKDEAAWLDTQLAHL